MTKTHELKTKLKTGGAVGLGMGASAFFGFAQGSGLEHVFADKIIEALKDGDLTKLAGYGLIFILIWLQVRALKNEVAKLNSPDGIIAKSFAKGEARFEAIEKTQDEFRHELNLLKNTQGGNTHERPSFI